MKYTRLSNITIKQLMLLIICSILLITAMLYIKEIFSMLNIVLRLIEPFFYGFGFAFIFHIPLNFFLKKLPKDIHKGRKVIAVSLSLCVILSIIAFIIRIVVPQFAQSFQALIQNWPLYAEHTMEAIDSLLKETNLSASAVDQLNQYSGQIQSTIMNMLGDIAPAFIATAKGVINGITNFVLSIVIAIYFIAAKDTLLRHVRKLIFAFTSQKVHLYLVHVAKVSNQVFENFISGQLIEAIIIGILCYIGCLFLGIPYAPVVSVIVGCTNVIPIFGPIIGTIVCSLLILFVEPIKAIIFIIFGIVLQQFEANIIYPKVVGTSIGLSGLWVLFAVTIGGGLFGLMGMLLGLPTFAVIYTLLSEEVTRRVQKKKAMGIELP